MQRGSISVVMRAIPVMIKAVDELGLPEAVTQLAEEERGIILLTGTTGSGKSTTLAAMIDHMNRTMHKHIVTIEDPIEFLHRDRNSIVNQREVGQDTASFKRALRRVLRQDPDVILVGEMRDEETVHTALSAAETGHLVLSTLHTVDASETINRIIDFFPPHQQQQARAMIAGTLKGIVSQRLVRTADGKGRVACCEILVMTGRVHDMILDPKLTGQLPEVIAEGAYYGMQTFDQHLLAHLHAGRITFEDALRVATSPHDFKLMVAAQEKRPRPETAVSGDPDCPGREPTAAPAARSRRAVGAVGRAAGRAHRAAAAPSPAAPPAGPRRRSAGAPPRPSAPPPPSPPPPELLVFPKAGSREPALTFPRSARVRQPPSIRKDSRRADDPRELQGSRVAERVLAAELQAAQGRAQPGRRSRPSSARWSPTRARCKFEHAGSGGLGRMLKKAVTRRGDVADEDERGRRGVPGRPGAGRPPDLPRERLHHGQRARTCSRSTRASTGTSSASRARAR